MHFLFGKMVVHNQIKGRPLNLSGTRMGPIYTNYPPPKKHTTNQGMYIVEDIWRFGQRRLDSVAIIHQCLNMIRTNRTVHGWSLWLLNHPLGLLGVDLRQTH